MANPSHVPFCVSVQAGYLEKALEIANWAMCTGLTFTSTTYKELIQTIEVAQIWDKKALEGIPSGHFLQVRCVS